MDDQGLHLIVDCETGQATTVAMTQDEVDSRDQGHRRWLEHHAHAQEVQGQRAIDVATVLDVMPTEEARDALARLLDR